MMFWHGLLQMKADAVKKVVLLLLFLFVMWWKLQPNISVKASAGSAILSLAIVILLRFVSWSDCTTTMKRLRRLFSCTTRTTTQQDRPILASTTTLTSAMDLTENERQVCRQRQFRIPPLDYLKSSPEQRSDQRNAMAALMYFNFADKTSVLAFVDDAMEETNLLKLVVRLVQRYCPRLFSTTANSHLQQLLLYACSSVLEPVLMKFRDAIEWNQDLACQAIQRYLFSYELLPELLQNNDDVLFKALSCGLDPSEIEHYLLSKNKEFILKAVQISPAVYLECAPSFMTDTDVLLQVIGNGDSSFFMEFKYTLRINFGRNFLRPFILSVETRLKAHTSFQALLACITAADVRSQQAKGGKDGDALTTLQLFQCGDETSIALKRSIGEFLGAPIHGGDEVTKLKRCWANIETYFHKLIKAQGQSGLPKVNKAKGQIGLLLGKSDVWNPHDVPSDVEQSTDVHNDEWTVVNRKRNNQVRQVEN